jgi:apolipoprotein N-acyltransferase
MKFLMRYFTTPTISLGFLSAISASLFIYLYHFDIRWPWLQSLLALLALVAWLRLPPRAMFWSGFFTGIFWFWWIGMSFRYYDLTWMIPFVILAIGLVYGIIFRLLGALSHPALRAFPLAFIEWLHPFGFDWFRPALMFTGSLLGDRLWHYWLILAILTIVLSLRRKARYLAFAALFIVFHRPSTIDHRPDLARLRQSVQIVQTNIEQDKKWQPRYRNAIVELNLHAIRLAAEQGKKAVILPESAFPLYLNHDIELVGKLLQMSRSITIVTGSLYYEKGKSYNSAYLFRNGRMRVMHKVVLVPFGEAVPLPRWMGRWINEIFFDGASDYVTAAAPSDFEMAGRVWRNAICYEATSDRLFEGNPKLMAAMSNNAWFTPSTEPTLQRLLMRLQADRHGTVIFHATNGPGTGVITPR